MGDSHVTWIVGVYMAVIASLFICLSQTAKTDQCEVCVKFMTQYIDSLNGKIDDDVQNEATFRQMCKTAPAKEERFCYHVGGLDHSATSIVNDIMQSVKFGLPADKICAKIKQKIPDICDLKYDKPVDLSNLNKLKVKELKKVLAQWGEVEACRGCIEKHEYVKTVERLIPKYAPQFAKPKQEL